MDGLDLFVDDLQDVCDGVSETFNLSLFLTIRICQRDDVEPPVDLPLEECRIPLSRRGKYPFAFGEVVGKAGIAGALPLKQLFGKFRPVASLTVQCDDRMNVSLCWLNDERLRGSRQR